MDRMKKSSIVAKIFSIIIARNHKHMHVQQALLDTSAVKFSSLCLAQYLGYIIMQHSRASKKSMKKRFI
jgi:hypothetical protein